MLNSIFIIGVILRLCLVSCNVRDGVAVAYNDYGFVCNDSGVFALAMCLINESSKA